MHISSAKQPRRVPTMGIDVAPRARAGFTILELVVVMMLTSIVVGMALPQIDLMAMEMNAAGRQVSMTLLKAQRQAVLRQHAVVVALDTAARRLRVHEDNDNDGVIDNGELLNFVQLEGAVVFSRGSAPALAFGSAAISLAKTQDGMPAVTFHRSGSASEYGGFYITSRRDVGGGIHTDHARAFEVNRATGRISLFQHDGSWRSVF
jgi:prepilin-type N-terminal cleavage/methylation domain-containing protein